MSKREAPPLQHPLVNEDGTPSIPWVLFFNALYTGDRGSGWSPTFTGLTISGVPTVTGKYYRLSDRLVYFTIRVVPGTSTTATAGATYASNFPLTFNGDGACLAVSGNLGSGAGMIDATNQRIYVPSWSAVTVPLTIVGMAEAS